MRSRSTLAPDPAPDTEQVDGSERALQDREAWFTLDQRN